MKPSLLVLLALLCIAMFNSGCVVTQTSETFILDTKVNGPTTEIPVHVVTPSTPHEFTVTPHLTFGPRKSLGGIVEGSTPSQISGFYPPGTVPEHNLKWDLPSTVVGIDVDYAGESTALTFGANYSSSGGSSRWGILASVGSFSLNDEKLGVRLDVGLSLQGISQRTYSVVVTTTETSFFGSHTVSVDTAFYLDTFNENRFGYFASLTLNSMSESLPVNFAFQAAFHRQTLINFEPRTQIRHEWLAPIPFVIQTRSSGGEASTGVSFISIAPALYMDVTPTARIVGGVRILWPISENIKTSSSIAVPFIRFDYVIK